MKSQVNNIKPAIHCNTIDRVMKTNSALPATLRSVVLLAFLLNAALCWAAADANPPERMTYQGYLTDPNGDPLGSTNTGPKNYDVIFRMYTDVTGGALVWAEQQTVTVDKGYFSVLLGEGTPVLNEPKPTLMSTLFNTNNASDRYIQLTVQGIGPSGGPVQLAPRLRLLTSPYAFLARNAVSANTLANSTSSSIVTVSGTNVGINQATPTSALDVNGTVTATGLKINGTAGISTLTVTNNATISGALTVPTLNVSGTAGIATLRVTNNETVSGSLTVTGTTTAGNFVGYGTIPIGGIIMWSGAVNAIPAGWALCDGNWHNYVLTPDLTDRFVLGAGRNYAPGGIGGAATHTLTTNEIPSHTHGVNQTAHNFHDGATSDDRTIHQVVSSYSSPYSTTATGGGAAFSIMPPWYSLAYIMRVQ